MADFVVKSPVGIFFTPLGLDRFAAFTFTCCVLSSTPPGDDDDDDDDDDDAGGGGGGGHKHYKCKCMYSIPAFVK